jgi:hypothetical protein
MSLANLHGEYAQVVATQEILQNLDSQPDP